MSATKLKEEKKPSSSSTSTIAVYLQEISRFPLLDEEEEIILGKQVQRMMSLLEEKEKLEQRRKRIVFSFWVLQLKSSIFIRLYAFIPL